MGKEQKQRVVRTSAILVTLLLTALLCARGATQLLASMVLPLAPDSVPQAPRLRAAPDEQRETTRQIAEAVLRRNMFDSQTGAMEWDAPLPAEQPVASESELPMEVVTDPDGEPAFCSSPIRLVASMVVPQKPELSFASIEVQGKSLLYRQGMQVEGHEVVGIREHRVFLRPSAAPICQIAMFAPPQPATPPPAQAAAPAPAAPAEAKKAGGPSEEELNQGITQVSDTKYTVSRSLLDKVLSNQAELMRAARIIPYEENGRTVGVKVYGIRRTSLLGKLGIQNGDILRTVNGLDLSSPDSALEAYTKLRETDNFSIAMIRRGQPRTMEYSVQ